MEMPAIKVPTLFIANSIILLASSWSIIQTKNAFNQDDAKNLKKYLQVTLLLSLLFLLMQAFGWKQLFNNNIFLHTENSSSYLYVLSGLHFAHVLFGLPFLYIFYNSAKKRLKDEVSALVFFSDPSPKLRLHLLGIYWHFLDGLWIYLVLFLLANWIIQ